MRWVSTSCTESSVRSSTWRRGITLSGGALATLLTQHAASAAVPTSLHLSTIQAAQLTAAGAATAGVISANVAALTEGVLQAMFLTKIKMVVTLLLVLGMLTTGMVMLFSPDVAAQPVQVKKDDAGQDKKAKPDAKKKAAKKEAPKKADPFVPLKEKLKKQEDEIAKIRSAMLQEVEKEEKQILEAITKAKQAQKAGDKSAVNQIAELQSKIIQLSRLRHDIELRIRVGSKPKKTAKKPVEQEIGLHLDTPRSQALRAQLGLAKNQGLIVERVDADSAAAKAGLQPHDVLLQVGGKSVPSDVAALRKMLTAGSTDLLIVRQGKQETIKGLTIPTAAK